MKIAVIGAGLIGSAAARHLALAGHRVVLIGPGEPRDKRRHQGVFGSHYDEGRITRRLATSNFWAQVSTAALTRYGEIEVAGKMRFYTPCGAMMAGPDNHEFTRAADAVATDQGIACERLSGTELHRRFPFFNFPLGTTGLFEASGGHISPRHLVTAQTRAAQALGADCRAVVATGVSSTASGVRVTTQAAPVMADAALITAGAMTDHLAPRRLAQRVYARTVALFEVDAAQAARLAAMPSLVFRSDGSDAEPYLLPPIRYPDGKVYLKLGGDPDDRTLQSPGEIGDWFRSGGNGEVRDHLEAQLRQLMPDLAIRATRMDACVTSFTPSGRPVIDWLGKRIAVASGGNGAGAKCSDELGRLGAVLVSGGTDPLLAQTHGQT